MPRHYGGLHSGVYGRTSLLSEETVLGAHPWETLAFFSSFYRSTTTTDTTADGMALETREREINS